MEPMTNRDTGDEYEMAGPIPNTTTATCNCGAPQCAICGQVTSAPEGVAQPDIQKAIDDLYALGSWTYSKLDYDTWQGHRTSIRTVLELVKTQRGQLRRLRGWATAFGGSKEAAKAWVAAEPADTPTQESEVRQSADRPRSTDVAQPGPNIPEDGWPTYDVAFGDDRLCHCGHPYYRHFDSYENNTAVGCKCCSCATWSAPLAQPVTREELMGAIVAVVDTTEAVWAAPLGEEHELRPKRRAAWKALADLLNRLFAPKAAPQPVGWQHRIRLSETDVGPWGFLESKSLAERHQADPNYEVRPLYAAPPEQGVEALRENIAKVLEGFDKGFFVRNTEGDGESDWAVKLLPYVVALSGLASKGDTK